MSIKPPSPGQRAWLRFKANRRGYVSLWIFSALFLLSLCAEVLSNDKPLLVSYHGSFYFPIVKNYPETVFGGDFESEANYNDAYLIERLNTNGNWVWYAPNRYSFETINFATEHPHPAPPSAHNLLGTDDRGRYTLRNVPVSPAIHAWTSMTSEWAWDWNGRAKPASKAFSRRPMCSNVSLSSCQAPWQYRNSMTPSCSALAWPIE